MTSLKHVYLDFWTQDLITISCTQYDKDSRTFIFHLLDDGKPFLLNESQYTLIFKMKKNDNKLIMDYCTIQPNGTVSLTLSEQACLCKGLNDAQLMLMNKDENKIIHTIPFRLNIIQSVVDVLDSESRNEFDVINRLIMDCDDIVIEKFSNDEPEFKYEGNNYWLQEYE